MRGATRSGLEVVSVKNISIHTPHAGSDRRGQAVISKNADFNPHSPCGERRAWAAGWYDDLDFSIHTPHAGSDFTFIRSSVGIRQFQSTLPMRGATRCRAYGSPAMDRFQSTLPMRGATEFNSLTMGEISISIHTPHAGSDPPVESIKRSFRHFNPHSPCGERLH